MSRNLFSKCILGCGLALAVLVPPGSAHGNAFSLLYSFTGRDGDGSGPKAGLIMDSSGNLYGTTYYGGADGFGVVFKLALDGTETILHSFTGGGDGRNPLAGLIMDTKGNLYGTTSLGGADNWGGVFKLAPDNTETELHFFTGGSDGRFPRAGLIMDKNGNLYGTTFEGGPDNQGVVFKLAPDGAEAVLYSFTGGSDGSAPYAGLIMDKKGNLYSTTYYGGTGTGCGGDGCGTVFKLAPDGTETVLYSFTGGSDGGYPSADLIMDSSGDLCSTTGGGGAADDGVVFKLAPDGTETVLYSFSGGSDGSEPLAGLILDKKGNLYGTTETGGAVNRGVVFKLAPDGTETVLHSFTKRSGGKIPQAGLIMDKTGNLYSSTYLGGADRHGVVFRLKK